jgi:hypothetical protein
MGFEVLTFMSQRAEPFRFDCTSEQCKQMYALTLIRVTHQQNTEHRRQRGHLTCMTSATFAHCSFVRSQPVGLCAHICRIITAFSGACWRSSIIPSKSMSLLTGSQYRYRREVENPACRNVASWLSAIDQKHTKELFHLRHLDS